MTNINIPDEDNSFFDNAQADTERLELNEDATTNSFQWDTFYSKTNGSVTNTDIESIINALGSGEFVVPGFQRKFVWRKEQVAGLAFSLIKGIPIPPIYVYYDEDGNQVILDGQQRLTAVFLYFHSLFFSSANKRKKLDFIDIDEKKRRLNVLNSKIKNGNTSLDIERKKILSELKDKYELIETEYEVEQKGDEGKNGRYDITFANLSEKETKLLKRRALQFAIVQCDDDDNKQKFYAMVFNMLNSAGKSLGPQEIRNGLFWRTTLYRELFRINENNPTWRNIYGNTSLYSKDVEILLKMLALNYYTDCTKDNKIVITHPRFNWSNIMMAYSDMLKTWSEEDVMKSINNLRQFFDMIELDGETKKCKKAVLEAVYVTSNKIGIIQDKINKQFKIKMSWLIELSKNEEIFGDGKVLSNKDSVQQRLTKTLPLVREEYGKY